MNSAEHFKDSKKAEDSYLSGEHFKETQDAYRFRNGNISPPSTLFRNHPAQRILFEHFLEKLIADMQLVEPEPNNIENSLDRDPEIARLRAESLANGICSVASIDTQGDLLLQWGREHEITQIYDEVCESWNCSHNVSRFSASNHPDRHYYEVMIMLLAPAPLSDPIFERVRTLLCEYGFSINKTNISPSREVLSKSEFDRIENEY